MVEINLLPWRQNIHAKKQRRIKGFLLSMLASLLLVFLLSHVIFSYVINKAEENILSLQQQQDQAATASSADEIDFSILENAKANQKKIHALLDKIKNATEYQVHLTKVNFTEQRIIFIGETASLYHVAHWMKGLRVKEFKVEKIKESDLQKFNLVVE